MEKSDKFNLIKAHLISLYGNINISKRDLERVYYRMFNLNRSATMKRQEYEKYQRQHDFMKNNWHIIKRCQCCGYKFKNQNETSLEHVIPLCLGGDDHEQNWQLLCKACNSAKGSFFGYTDYQVSNILVSTGIIKGLSFEKQLEKVTNTILYFVLERDSRSCTECENTCENTQLFICITDSTHFLTLESFSTLCEKCFKTKNIQQKYRFKLT